jgi:hypothetical protein
MVEKAAVKHYTLYCWHQKPIQLPLEPPCVSDLVWTLSFILVLIRSFSFCVLILGHKSFPCSGDVVKNLFLLCVLYFCVYELE